MQAFAEIILVKDLPQTIKEKSGPTPCEFCGQTGAGENRLGNIKYMLCVKCLNDYLLGRKRTFFPKKMGVTPKWHSWQPRHANLGLSYARTKRANRFIC